MDKPSILIVDDEAFMRRVVRQTLTTLGITDITEADSAISALSLFGKKTFDLILCDIYMPNMSGLELLKEIRSGKTKTPNDSRLIFLTSFSNTEVLKTSMELDVNGFLVKPIKSNLVKKKILAALNENMFLQDEEMYQDIDIDMQWTSKLKEEKVISVGKNKSSHTDEHTPEPDPNINDTDTDLPEDVILASILQLEPDSILAENLTAKDHTLLLSAGQKLSAQIINRMHDLRDILHSDFIKIIPPAEDS